MSRMVNFRLARECREVTINPNKVLYVCRYEHGASSIHFGKECQLRVQGEVAEVVAKIEAGLCGDVVLPASRSQPGETVRQRPEVN